MKIAAAAVLASLAVIGTLSTTGAGDEEIITESATPTATATEAPLTVEELMPAEFRADVPADVETPAAEQPAPEDLPGEWYGEAVPWVPGAAIDGEIRQPHEDEPGFDCRIHGNNQCGVEIYATPYVVTFDQAGQPTGAYQQ